MKKITVKLNSETGKQTFYVMANHKQLMLTASKKEAYNKMSPPIVAKIEIYSDSVFSSVEDMNKNYRKCAINALKEANIIDAYEQIREI